MGLLVIAWGLVALALYCQRTAACLALLATPWDFHAQAGQTLRLAFAADRLARLCGPAGTLPVATIQTLSFVLDPFTAEGEFIRFAIFDPEATSALSAARAPDGLEASIATWLRTRLG
jgi:polyhydroxyalkanoate synthase